MLQLFKQTNIDFLGRRRFFVSVSLVLILAAAASMASKGGLKLGIDFKGGTLLYLRFKNPPPVDEIRTALASRGLSISTLQSFQDDNELKIDLDLSRDQALSTGKVQIMEALSVMYPPPPNKLDFNNIGPEVLAAKLQDDDRLRSSFSSEQIEKASQALTAARVSVGLIREYSELQGVEAVDPAILSVLPDLTYLGEFVFLGAEVVGPKVGADLQVQALKATLAALAAMAVYLAFRFEWIYGCAAVLAVFHDVFVTLGFFSFFDQPLELNVIAGLLTLVGYSVNDTIVIFDRLRENLKLTRRMPLEELLNRSVNQTLGRTVITSALAFVPVLCLYLFGGEVLRGFSFALVVGVVVGTYSSIFVASPIVLWWHNLTVGRRSGRRATTPETRASATPNTAKGGA